jgi:uncharacterized secreted protein with C-terminal beta-propeller domain
MKKKWFSLMGLANPDYVDEADPTRAVMKKSKTLIRVVAACILFMLVIGNLWLFLPHSISTDDISMYENSEYYSIISKINHLSAVYPEYKNNAEMLSNMLKGDDGRTDVPDTVPEFAPGSPMDNEDTGTDGDKSNDIYKEITDNQTEGVIEADLIKRSDTHIFYLDKNILRVFNIDKENTSEIANFEITNKYNSVSNFEFYLSSDAKTVTVIFNDNIGIKNRFVSVLSLDVENPLNIKVKSKIEISGKYISSRKVGTEILLFSEFAPSKEEIDFSDEASFLPQINTGSGFESIKPENIVVPDTILNTRYTVVLKLDEGTLSQKGTLAYLSYSDKFYVSSENIYFTRVFAEKGKYLSGEDRIYSKTEISIISYENELSAKGSFTLDGYIRNQYSMDEYNGILRVVTTTNERAIFKNMSADEYGLSYGNTLMTAMGKSNANLYCINVASLETVGAVIRFAPDYEEVQSVRFDKNYAYVCTSVEMSDPVFFFDLSDVENIVFKDTGTIDGYSTSLINLGGGYLLGVGVGARGGFKLEVYEETEDGVCSVAAYEIANADYSDKYKSYYINREKGIIGLGINDYSRAESSEISRYIVVSFDGYDLVELLNVALRGENFEKRGVLIEDIMYVFGNGAFTVEKIFN